MIVNDLYDEMMGARLYGGTANEGRVDNFKTILGTLLFLMDGNRQAICFGWIKTWLSMVGGLCGSLLDTQDSWVGCIGFRTGGDGVYIWLPVYIPKGLALM